MPADTTRGVLSATATANGWTIDPHYSNARAFRATRGGDRESVTAEFNVRGGITYAGASRPAVGDYRRIRGTGRRGQLIAILTAPADQLGGADRVTRPQIRTESQGSSWDVQSTETPRGARYRYYCRRCGTPGRWWVNPNDADGDTHLATRHGEG